MTTQRPCGGRRSAGCSTTTCTPPTRPTGNCTRSGAGCRYRSPARRPRSPALATQEDAAAWLEAEWRNVLQAAQYAARHEWKRKCADLIHALAGFVQIKAHWDEAIAAHTLALQASRDIADPGRIALAALELSEVSQETGRHEAMLPLAEDAAAIYRSQGDRRGEAHALDQMGMAHARVTRYREALAYFHEARHRLPRRRGPARRGQHPEPRRHHLLASRAGYPDATDHLREALCALP